ncbi:DUF6206 family protein [Gymnodinialimonas sp. 2305UL16-5]|uniref:DUF6206 family protein n=1 Tax=Gymnodinialimonas mytili TaxID=3126503 RepID=UPI0030A13D8C
MSDLTGAIRSTLSDSATPAADPRYFGLPLRPQSGPLAGYVVTAYRGGRDPDVQELLVRRHAAYVDCLTLAGVRVPETQIRLIDDAGTQRPVIVQQAIPDAAMMPRMMQHAAPQMAIDLLDQVATQAAEFWRRVAQRPERIGLHAQLDRFALAEDGALVFLDTFPPLIAYSRDEMGVLIQRFADNALIRGLGKVLPGRIRDVQDRWYTPAGSVSTLIEGALKLRPQDHDAIIAWAEHFAATRLEGPWRNAVQAQLARQERLHRARVKGWPGLSGRRDRPHA